MRLPVALAGAALVLAITAALYLALADTYRGQVCRSEVGGPTECTSESSTLIEENGRGVMFLLLVPVAASAAVTAALYGSAKAGHNAGRLLAIALVLGCVVSVFSIGMFFAPAALLLLVATLVEPRRVPART